jgi:hypothetical protein
MKKIIFFMLILTFLSPVLNAQTTGQDRRIEEEKRQSLESTAEYRPLTKAVRFKSSGEFNTKYFEQLFLKKVALRQDACRVLIMLMGYDSQYPAEDIESRISFLIKNKIIPEKNVDNFDAHAPLRKGEAAYMFCKTMQMRGGLWIRLFGLNQRYALKELIYHGMMPAGATSEIVSGKELIFLLTESARYVTKKMTE